VRSWVAGMSTNTDPDYDNLGNNDLLGTIDSFGLPGNWLIRANGTVGGGGGCASPTPGGGTVTPTISTPVATPSNPAGTPTSAPTATAGTIETATSLPATATAIATLPPTSTPSPGPTCGAGASYEIIQTTGTLTPAENLLPDSRCDDCMLRPIMPFAYRLYGQIYTTIDIGSNGYLQFNMPTATPVVRNACDPPLLLQNSIIAFWNDLDMSSTAIPNLDLGIYTDTEGVAPDRIFDIEWRAVLSGTTDYVNFEVRLYEGQSRYDVIFGSMSGGGNSPVSVRGETASLSTVLCEPPAVPNFKVVFTQPQCAINCPLDLEDVPNGSTFYPFVHCLACQGILTGYPCGGPGEPCLPPDNKGYFRPGNNASRGQIAKIVSNASGFTEPHTEQSFEDIPTNHTFYTFIERLASRNVISGYACGAPNEPCIPPGNRPYYRSGNNASRGQIAKIVCRAYNCVGQVNGQTFEDVPQAYTFYADIEHLYNLGAISGYACSNPEPCVPPGNRPYFRPGNSVTRAQTSKIVSNTFYPDCNLP
jgi:hypothetical protein